MANHDWQTDICPECGEETNTNRVLPFRLAVTHCTHCLWTADDDPLAGLTLCDCSCHKEEGILHCVPCCDAVRSRSEGGINGVKDL